MNEKTILQGRTERFDHSLPVREGRAYLIGRVHRTDLAETPIVPLLSGQDFFFIRERVEASRP